MSTTKSEDTRDAKASTPEKILPWVGLGARLLTGVVWVIAGGIKLSDLKQSVYAVNAYQILPTGLARVVGIGLPLLEVGVGVLLILGLATQAAGALSTVMQLAFIIGISAAWARGLSIDCGCFGGGGQLAAGQHPVYIWDILRDVGLLLCSALLVWRPRTKFSADQMIFTTK
ncbi:MAG TPA: MauE/DoxX family redox-associated membrane protein [Stackebrandtia sp.]|jgi:uncharacterized membrane protein YphA (DoxX/SURF4 family)|uniref:MauE/DoxX family redox-associated membrane protein n=1 Tax=Stackebrandtia sp. TaxID=2023065 RepID=UPI002D4B0CC5|nr:MauE/DoxX family redox-associated membrane protein [Stackebrandtia sp.]HZE41892.1 MauE/DoxX family redox-associated membrane protein [Stackebrandtia sp.]